MVSFEELVEQLQQVPFDEVRRKYEGYLEFVLPSHHLTLLYPVFEKYFGVPFKPAGISPTREAEDRAKRYGGIRTQQTLYFIQRGGLAHCAMIWPWADGSRVTVKVAQGTIEETKV